MSHGTVVHLSPNQGMVVVQHDDGFTVVELIGNEGDLELGDRLIGNWEDDGGETIRVPRLQANFDVYMQGTWASKADAIRVARGR